MKFFGPLLKFLGYTVSGIFDDTRTAGRLTVNINESNGTAVNVWEAKGELKKHPFEVYEPGLHHVAFNVQRHEQVDRALELVRSLEVQGGSQRGRSGTTARWSKRSTAARASYCSANKRRIDDQLPSGSESGSKI